MPTPRAITDDKSGPIISFILSRLSAHRQRHHPTSPPPLIIGLSGPQGVGKTTLVSTLTHHLSAAPHNLLTLPLSIDDLYLPRTAQVALSAAHATNHLLAHRGQPGTHDVALGLAVLRGIREGRPTRVPRYDKAAFGGAGDRVPAEEWEEVQGGQESSVNVVILEGWCVGFRALGVEGVEGAWRRVREERREGSRLARCALQEVMEVDGFLRGYEGLTR
ncbi:MAG: hypothetical protein M1816_000113 [Peltula sp. TS41687]|nr:MAG: hypothetical protein M1816_000113 [Peltula sp. TS41687]